MAFDIVRICTLLLISLIAVHSQFMPPFQYPYAPQENPLMSIQMPKSLPGSVPQGMQLPMFPNLPHMTGANPMPMPPIQLPLNGGRLPMVIMPHHTKSKGTKRHKKKKHNYKKAEAYSSESDASSDCESEEFRSKNHFRSSSKKRRREVLTPVVSYVTKEGYVVYQKKIKKEKAKDWLELKNVGSEEFDRRH